MGICTILNFTRKYAVNIICGKHRPMCDKSQIKITAKPYPIMLSTVRLISPTTEEIHDTYHGNSQLYVSV